MAVQLSMRANRAVGFCLEIIGFGIMLNSDGGNLAWLGLAVFGVGVVVALWHTFRSNRASS